jgi:hypothetical protein
MIPWLKRRQIVALRNTRYVPGSLPKDLIAAMQVFADATAALPVAETHFLLGYRGSQFFEPPVNVAYTPFAPWTFETHGTPAIVQNDGQA